MATDQPSHKASARQAHADGHPSGICLVFHGAGGHYLSQPPSPDAMAGQGAHPPSRQAMAGQAESQSYIELRGRRISLKALLIGVRKHPEQWGVHDINTNKLARLGRVYLKAGIAGTLEDTVPLWQIFKENTT